jgi:hypothetical protein
VCMQSTICHSASVWNMRGVVCGVWCVWCVVCGVWCVVCGVCGVCGVWCVCPLCVVFGVCVPSVCVVCALRVQRAVCALCVWCITNVYRRLRRRAVERRAPLASPWSSWRLRFVQGPCTGEGEARLGQQAVRCVLCPCSCCYLSSAAPTPRTLFAFSLVARWSTWD